MLSPLQSLEESRRDGDTFLFYDLADKNLRTHIEHIFCCIFRIHPPPLLKIIFKLSSDEFLIPNRV